ncbi:MAG: 5-oxoprolinase subunit PxpA [Spirochaetaceae bacterium]|nr:MAG: 5-oxoprolinase subunit PxpA [Spirochaetaceae bacterium]
MSADQTNPNTRTTVDLNADIGEGFGRYRIEGDEALLRLISSANIACGFHAGDANTMAETVTRCRDAGVAIGAHPGFPDLLGFGRRRMEVEPAEVANMLIYQMGALDGFARVAGVRLHHVKLHGALYNMAAVDPELADAVAQAVFAYDPLLLLVAPGGSCMDAAARRVGLRLVREVFADRAYRPDGTLVDRSRPGAVLTDPDSAATRIARLIRDGCVAAEDGTLLDIEADSICVHGDNEAALAMVAAIRRELAAADIEVRACDSGAV